MSGWPGLALVAALSAALTIGARHWSRAHPRSRRFFATSQATVGFWLLLALSGAAAAAPLIAPADPRAVLELSTHRLLPPGWVHPLGTDGVARDVLSRLLYGARTSLGIAATAVALSATVGVLVGLLAGVAGRIWDAALMRLVDAALAVPRIFLVLVIVALWDRPTPFALALLLGATGWFVTSRLVRAETLSVRERDFILAARALGAPAHRIVFHHVLPHIGATAVVSAALGLGNVILVEAGLAYLGLSVRAPAPTWGFMVAEGTPYLRTAPWLVIVPGAAIAATVLAVSLTGDGLRAALRPRERL